MVGVRARDQTDILPAVDAVVLLSSRDKMLDFLPSYDFCSRSDFDQHKIEFLEKSQKFETVHYSHFSQKL